jgi:hypothetical protein
VATIATGSVGVTSAAAIDPAGGRFFLYASVDSGPFMLYTVNIPTGQVNVVAAPTSPFGVFIQYDVVNQTL